MTNKHSDDESLENLFDEPIQQNMEEEERAAIDYPPRAELEKQLTGMEMKVDEYKSMALRAQAELENVRRRIQRDVEDAHKYGSKKLIEDLLPGLDALQQSLSNTSFKDPHLKSMQDGIRLTLDLFEKNLAKHGLRPIQPNKGEVFNPELHQAMTSQSDPDAKPNTILEVLQKGYELNGRVLRPAMVIVAQ